MLRRSPLPGWQGLFSAMSHAFRTLVPSPESHIQFPLNGSRIDVAGSGGAQFSAMPVKVAGGVLPMTMLVNGVSVGEIDGRRQRLVDPPGPGFARLTVIDATGAADTIIIRIQ